MTRIIMVICIGVLAASLAPARFALAAGSVFIEELTWVVVRDAITAGKTTIIFPTGGS